MSIRVIYLTGEDWEAIYINGELIDEGHTLGEGNNFFYLLELAEKYKFKRKDVIHLTSTPELETELEKDGGSMPSKFFTLAHLVDWGKHAYTPSPCNCSKELEKCCDSVDCPFM